jgi:hypothetical protein
VPRSVLETGIVENNTQYYSPYLLSVYDEAIKNTVDLNDLNFRGSPSQRQTEEDARQEVIARAQQLGLGTEGVLVPTYKLDEEGRIATENGQITQSVDNWRGYQIGDTTPEGFVFGPILGTVSEGGGVRYNVQGGGQPGAYARADAGGVSGTYEIPGKKWYETPLGALSGIALLASGAGLLGYGPLAAGGAAGAAGTGAGLVGTPGVSTIFPVAAPVAPTVTSLAPIATATAVPAAQLAFPGLEVAPTFTPAPGSLQAALPGLGVETAASAAPFTAVPGSFQAALPALGIASSPSLAGNLATSAGSGISATDALRIANQAQGLLGAGQNPIIPQQQGLPQSGRGSQGVDYSGLLSLLQLQAGTPGVSSLTAPAQLRQMYQPTLLPNVLSLLG